MPVYKAANVFSEFRMTIDLRKIAVALRAGLIFRRHKIDTATMFAVALRAGNSSIGTERMVRWPVMTGQTSRISGCRRKSSYLLHVTRGALLLQNRVSQAQPPARINTIVPSQNVPANPQQRDRRRKYRQP